MTNRRPPGLDRRTALAAITAAPLAAGAQGPAPNADDALVKRYARRPLLEQVALSPDGRTLGAIVNNARHTMLITRETGGPPRTVFTSDNLENHLNWFRWVNPKRLVLSLRFAGARPLGDARTVPTIETRLVAADVDGGNLVNLARPRPGDFFAVGGNLQDRVVDWLPDDGQHILLALRPHPENPATGVYRVNVDTGRNTEVQGPRDQVLDWITDATHRVRVGIEFDDGKTSLWVCNADGKDWRRLHAFGPLAVDRMHPLGFGRDPNALYVTTAHQGLQAIHRVNLADPKAAPVLVYAHPEHDLDGGELVRDPRSGEAVGIALRFAGGSSLYYWDAETKALAAAIDAALPGRVNELRQLLRDGTTYIVRSHGNGMPPVYLVGDRKAGKLGPLAEEYEHLDPGKLPKKQELVLKARDGLALPSFLTLPPTPAAKAPHPLVVLPHGGPQAADSLAFEPLVCFIAELGCAVLQVNFRGSTGYGQSHLERGLRRWGLEMQDDLTDAVEALVKDGTADRERLAIVGTSYGGYAALMGGIRTPKLYQGVFAIAPVTDLVELVGEAERKHFVGRADYTAVQIGTLANDRERLRATSPRHQAQAITVPVVLVHGTADRQVPFEHSEWMAAALRKAGKDVRLVALERGDPGLSHVPHRERTYAELAAFLRRTLALKPAA